MFETKKDYNETEMGTLIERLYGSIAIKEQALSSKIFLWDRSCCLTYQRIGIVLPWAPLDVFSPLFYCLLTSVFL